MAQRRAQLDSLKMSCSICLELLRDPATIPCGHSYCMSCIQTFWNKEGKTGIYSCPLCRQTFTPRPVLAKSVALADLVEELKKSGLGAPAADLCYAGASDVACDVCQGRKLKAAKSCLVCVASFCEEHLRPHYQAAPLKKHRLVAPSHELQDNLCPRHNEPMKFFSHTDQQLICSRCTMADHKSRDTVTGAAGRVSTRQNTQSVRRRKDTSIPQAAAQAGVSPQQMAGLSRAQFLRFSCVLTLDPRTADRYLVLSEGGRKVTFSHHKQPYSRNESRFTKCLQVLSRESLTGCCYWEVEWTGYGVGVAVAYDSIGRTGRTDSFFGYNDKSWALLCDKTRYEFYHDGRSTAVSGPPCRRVGVFLDQREGILSFYSISESVTLLHRIRTTFSQPLHAGLTLYGYSRDTAEFCQLR